LFQLFYKNRLDTDFLVYVINKLLGSNEFFINKAIGWILRQYSKTNPRWVTGFVANTPQLNSLSKREAMKVLKNKR
jgi:3-methyladenine DNA glycosylase AlkD